MVDSSPLSQRIIGIALLSASSLFLEIVLTRLFSVIYYPPYVFFIISFAILGIGLGAAICAVNPVFHRDSRLVFYACGASLSSLLVLIFSVWTVSLDLQIILFALLIIPYVFVGLSLSALFSQYAESSSLLYMSDLVGAGIGALLVIPAVNTFGAINGVMIAAFGFAISAIYFYTSRYRVLIAVTILITAGLFASNVVVNWLTLDMGSLATDKPITNVLKSGGEIIQTVWDAFARTDLVDPGGDDPLRIYVDGGAASIMPSAESNSDLVQDIGFFPFATEQPERVFVVGPGAGLDVWFGLQSTAREIVAVEVNPASITMVQDLGAHNGHLYTQSNVEVINDDGRNVLRRSSARYDLIFLSQVVTLVAERGGFALSENAIYTVEAFDEYLSHLTENGQIALKLYDEITLTRAVSTAISSLRKRGLSDQKAMQHLLILLDTNASPPIPLLLVRNAPFSEDDALVLGTIARDVGFTPVLLPHVLVQPPLDAVADGTDTFETIIASSEYDISAPVDDRPYFFQFEFGVPQTLQSLSLLVAFIVAGGLAIYAYFWFKSSHAVARYMPPYFAMLGIGFIAIEIYAIQQTRLFLGHPIFAVTLVLVTFLAGGGIGSGLSQRYARHLREQSPYWITGIVLGLFVIWIVVWNILSPQFISQSIAVRGVFVVVSLLPLTLFLGIPFPMGLSIVSQKSNRLVAVAWSVNGVATIAGTVVAVVLSILIGFTAVGIVGGIAYFVATGVLIMLRMREP